MAQFESALTVYRASQNCIPTEKSDKAPANAFCIPHAANLQPSLYPPFSCTRIQCSALLAALQKDRNHRAKAKT
jgi:hypothetical protein